MRPRLPGRSRRSLAVLVVALLGVGAFFARGPIGLGNGPLTFTSDSGITLGLTRQAIPRWWSRSATRARRRP